MVELGFFTKIQNKNAICLLWHELDWLNSGSFHDPLGHGAAAAMCNSRNVGS